MGSPKAQDTACHFYDQDQVSDAQVFWMFSHWVESVVRKMTLKIQENDELEYPRWAV